MLRKRKPVNVCVMLLPIIAEKEPVSMCVLMLHIAKKEPVSVVCLCVCDHYVVVAQPHGEEGLVLRVCGFM